MRAILEAQSRTGEEIEERIEPAIGTATAAEEDLAEVTDCVDCIAGVMTAYRG